MGIDLKEHIEKIIIAIILLSTMPVLIKVLKKKKISE
jgi:membrane-associated protein